MLVNFYVIQNPGKANPVCLPSAEFIVGRWRGAECVPRTGDSLLLDGKRYYVRHVHFVDMAGAIVYVDYLK